MSVWLRRVRAVVGMGLLWALGGIAVAGVLELLDNLTAAAHPVTRRVDMWPQTLAMLGFACGVLFAVLLGVRGRRRRFEEFTLAQFTAWGVAAGALLGSAGMALGAGPLLLLVTTLLGALGGASSLALARTAERRGLLGAAGTRGGPLAGGDGQRLPDGPR